LGCITFSTLINTCKSNGIFIKYNVFIKKFPSKVPASPYQMKTVTAATPITKAMELYNWMYSYIENFKKVFI
jgi:hypothetical protein